MNARTSLCCCVVVTFYCENYISPKLHKKSKCLKDQKKKCLKDFHPQYFSFPGVFSPADRKQKPVGRFSEPHCPPPCFRPAHHTRSGDLCVTSRRMWAAPESWRRLAAARPGGGVGDAVQSPASFQPLTFLCHVCACVYVCVYLVSPPLHKRIIINKRAKVEGQDARLVLSSCREDQEAPPLLP